MPLNPFSFSRSTYKQVQEPVFAAFIVILVKAVHPWNARPPIYVTLLGIVKGENNFKALCSIPARIHAQFFQAFLPLGLLFEGFQGVGMPGRTVRVSGLYRFGFAPLGVHGASWKVLCGLQRRRDALFYMQAAERAYLWIYHTPGNLPTPLLPFQGRGREKTHKLEHSACQESLPKTYPHLSLYCNNKPFRNPLSLWSRLVWVSLSLGYIIILYNIYIAL